jgi:competence protein ComEC
MRPPDPNNASVSLLLTVHGLRIALLGDVEPLAQQRIPLGRVDVLKVPHHGSSHQDEDLLGRLRPRLALISCGKDNRYGHPSPATIARLRGLGATVLRTDTQGALAVVGDAAHLGAVTEHPNNTSPGPAGSPPSSG